MDKVTAVNRATEGRLQLTDMKHDLDAIRRIFENGEYPYRTKMRRTNYEQRKSELQVKLLKVQR